VKEQDDGSEYETSLFKDMMQERIERKNSKNTERKTTNNWQIESFSHNPREEISNKDRI
jgi:hypothetical protein